MSNEMQPDETCEDYIDRIQKENPALMIAALQSAYVMVHHKIATKEQLFDLWFQENSEELETEFHHNENFREFAIQKFNQIIEKNHINIFEVDIDLILGRGRR